MKWLVLLGLCVVVADASCPNKVFREEVVSRFNQQVETNFVGQSRAVRTIRELLQDHALELSSSREGGPLVVHLVGPSGTGKTFMAEIMSTSLFDDCNTNLAAVQGHARRFMDGVAKRIPSVFPEVSMVRNVFSKGKRAFLSRRCDELNQKLEIWRQACGINYIKFHFRADDEPESEENPSDASQMRLFLEMAAKSLEEEPNSVLIFDDFNHCGRTCVSMLKELLTMHSITVSKGKQTVVSASRAVVVICSDLTNMGLNLDPDETYESALRAVEQATEEFWGKHSTVITKAHIIPFSPLTDAELLRIVENIVARAKRLVGKRISKALAEKTEKTGKNFVWQGTFICSAAAQQRIVDKLHTKVVDKNARALTEELWESLKRSTTKPKPIESRLERFKASSDGSMYSAEEISIVLSEGKTFAVELVIG